MEQINEIFNNFVILESAQNILYEYLNSIQNLGQLLIYKRLLILRELAKKKHNTSVIDDQIMARLIIDLKEFVKDEQISIKNNKKSFKEIDTFEDEVIDKEISHNELLYNTTITYVDAFEESVNIFCEAKEISKVFLTHYNNLKHFLFQNKRYKTKFQNIEALEINTLDCLQGSTEDLKVIGLIRFNEDGKLVLQDPFKIVFIDIEEAEWGKGFFPVGSIVLAEGKFVDQIFKVKIICQPSNNIPKRNFRDKLEKDYFGAISKAFRNDNENNRKQNKITMDSFINADISKSRFLYPKAVESILLNNLNTFTNNNCRDLENYLSISKHILQNEFIVVISNPNLNDPKIIEAIDKLIMGFEESVPLMIALMGNFTEDTSFNSFNNFSNNFDILASKIAKNRSLFKNTYIVLIPGTLDFGISSAFPKYPFDENFASKLRKKIPNLICASNPCRFNILGKEFVFFRDDLLKKLSRNSIVKCEDVTKVNEFYYYTIINQGNLSPVDLNITPRIWNMAQSMLILPPPDYLVIGDVTEGFHAKYNGVHFINTGNFSKDCMFNVIFPLKEIIEPSKIN